LHIAVVVTILQAVDIVQVVVTFVVVGEGILLRVKV